MPPVASSALTHPSKKTQVAQLNLFFIRQYEPIDLYFEEILRQQKDVFAPPLTVDAVSILHGLGRVLRDACTFTPI